MSPSEQQRRRRRSSVSVAPRVARSGGRGRGSSRPLISEEAFGIFTWTPRVLSRLAGAPFGLQRRSLNSLPDLISISRRPALKRQTPSKLGLGDVARLPHADVIPIKLTAFPVINGEGPAARRSTGDRSGSRSEPFTPPSHRSPYRSLFHLPFTSPPLTHAAAGKVICENVRREIIQPRHLESEFTPLIRCSRLRQD